MKGNMRELKGRVNNKGYLQVNLYKNGKKSNKTIHRLVAETFLERVEGKNEVDHIYNNILDNRVENLKWCDRRENNINKKMLKNNKSGVKGVRYRKDRNAWVACISSEMYKRKRKQFKKKEDAINWRLEMEKKYYTYMDSIKIL